MSEPAIRHSPVSPMVHFGGPGKPQRALRDLLLARVDLVPPGGRIRWATYYFRDEALARALVSAARRGVDVRLAVEGSPRLAHANDRVLDILRQGLPRGSLHVHAPPHGMPRKLHPHLHAKVYAFSHPEEMALIGSFNPSGNAPEDPAVIAEIGDQDRGHNLLVELRDPPVVKALRAWVESLGDAGGLFGRFRPASNRIVRSGPMEIRFFPRLRPGAIDGALALGPGDALRGAISHLKSGPFVARIKAAARRGASVELLVHDTERRVPERTVRELASAGVTIRRYVHPAGLPLHAKFLLVTREGRSEAWFGSFNFNPRSRWLNHEVLARSGDPALIESLSARFDEIAREAESYGVNPRPGRA